jgi:hypothetical protein
LKRNLKLRPASVNAAITAIDNFSRWLGLGAVKMKREDLPQEAPRALEPAEQGRYTRAAERCRRPKDTAIALLLLNTDSRMNDFEPRVSNRRFSALFQRR